ncbi:MAG TPA: T9SS type A sorting domain-containing protein [Parafilimonas sp.]|nr:T9SS type A sorting domain-containing protein [Parafilimonas sp.]
MKNYSRLCLACLLLFSMKLTAQLKVNPTVKATSDANFPYHLPQVANGIKTIKPVEIKAMQPAAIDVKPAIKISSSAQQCALLNSMQPSLQLEGERKDANLVDLKWQAKDLYDKKGFEVQRSIGDSNNFKSVTFVNAYAKALAKEEYRLTDINETIQPTYYRLKQVKPGGGHAYSNMVLINGILQFNLFPNPVADVLFLKLQTVKNSNVSIMIYDNKGVLVLGKQTDLTKDIINTQKINVRALRTGMYNVKVANADTTLYSDKFIKE